MSKKACQVNDLFIFGQDSLTIFFTDKGWLLVDLYFLLEMYQLQRSIGNSHHNSRQSITAIDQQINLLSVLAIAISLFYHQYRLHCGVQSYADCGKE